MLYHAISIFFWLVAPVLIILTTTSRPARWSYAPGLALLTSLACILNLISPPSSIAQHINHPPVIGVKAGLKLGLWQQSLLPPPKPQGPNINWLQHTLTGETIIAKPIIIFREPVQAEFRRSGVDYSFQHRFNWCCAMQTDTEPQAIIVHSTEGEEEAHAFNIFDRNPSDAYLGGVWTHFAVDPKGNIYQYGPLNRISKGQAGLDDIAVGIEIVGHASLWKENQQVKTGSIFTRYTEGNTAQIKAVLDLIQTLKHHYNIPNRRIYSHEELGHIRDLYGMDPDYQWLREHIRDGVYLNRVPTVDEKGNPRTYYGFLEPYDRQDPGKDIMTLLRQSL